eukprot:15302874-Alexandrium_andersonii.AAC.1
MAAAPHFLVEDDTRPPKERKVGSRCGAAASATRRAAPASPAAALRAPHACSRRAGRPRHNHRDAEYVDAKLI